MCVFQEIALPNNTGQEESLQKGSYVFSVTLPGSPSKAGKGLVAWEGRGCQPEQGQLRSSTLA